MPAILELDRLTKRYGEAIAISDISLEVREGEFVTLLGASGSGKSTVLMSIAGFVEPSAGDIRLRGRSLTGVPPHKRRVGVVFQNYALFPHLTVWDNLAFPLRNARWARAKVEARIASLIATVRLEGLGDRLPSQLSGGQQQRVAIARALAIGPDILLLDEPLGALDRSLREHMVLELQRLHRQLGTTMVYVTHDQEEALVMSDRIAVLDRGRLVTSGTPQALYDNPGTVFLATFLGQSNVVTTDRGRAVIRPERIAVGDLPPHWTRLDGSVREAIFLGDRIRYEVDVGAERPVTVSAPRCHDAPQYQVGDAVRIGWHPDDASLVAD